MKKALREEKTEFIMKKVIKNEKMTENLFRSKLSVKICDKHRCVVFLVSLMEYKGEWDKRI